MRPVPTLTTRRLDPSGRGESKLDDVMRLAAAGEGAEVRGGPPSSVIETPMEPTISQRVVSTRASDIPPRTLAPQFLSPPQPQPATPKLKPATPKLEPAPLQPPPATIARTGNVRGASGLGRVSFHPSNITEPSSASILLSKLQQQQPVPKGNAANIGRAITADFNKYALIAEKNKGNPDIPDIMDYANGRIISRNIANMISANRLSNGEPRLNQQQNEDLQNALYGLLPDYYDYLAQQQRPSDVKPTDEEVRLGLGADDPSLQYQIELDNRKKKKEEKAALESSPALPPPSAAALSVGSRVRIDGLKSQSKMNGRTGVVRGALDVETGRLSVDVDADQDSAAVNGLFIPVINLYAIEAKPSSAAPELVRQNHPFGQRAMNSKKKQEQDWGKAPSAAAPHSWWDDVPWDSSSVQAVPVPDVWDSSSVTAVPVPPSVPSNLHLQQSTRSSERAERNRKMLEIKERELEECKRELEECNRKVQSLEPLISVLRGEIMDAQLQKEHDDEKERLKANKKAEAQANADLELFKLTGGKRKTKFKKNKKMYNKTSKKYNKNSKKYNKNSKKYNKTSKKARY
jgi:hypothetical protein